MKKWIFLIITMSLFSCQSDSAFKDYRSQPFQYPYPEYYFKAEVISLKPSLTHIKPLIIDMGDRRLSFQLNINGPVQAEKKYHTFYLRSGPKVIGVLNFEKENFMGCTGKVKLYEKDFCSAFISSKEYYTKVFTLTPNDLRKETYAPMGNKWIVHNKGTWFRDVKQIHIYQSDKVTAFRRDFKDSKKRKTKTELIVFHKNLSPDYLGIALTISDEAGIIQLLSTLEVQ